MAYKVALNFEDDVTRFIECRPSETVADASYRLGINIPLDCRDGACGTCKVFCESGQYDGGDYIDDALTEDEAAQGFGLACQMRPKSELILRIAASSDLCKVRGAIHRAAVISVERLSDTSLGFSLKVDGGPPGFLPGQYVNIDVPGTDQKRSYSFSSAPGSAEIKFLIRDIPHGRMSSFLKDAAVPGTEMTFTGPSGTFYLRDIRRRMLFLAGGTGLAPFLSMLGAIEKTGSPAPIHLIYGVTNDADLVELAALEAYADKITNFTFLTCVASAASVHPWKGYVTSHIEPAHLDGGDVDVYLCGPPPMVDAVRTYLADRSISPANFYFEKFSPSGAVTTIGESHRTAS